MGSRRALWLGGAVLLACSSCGGRPADAGDAPPFKNAAHDAGTHPVGPRSSPDGGAPPVFADAGREILAGHACPLEPLSLAFKIVPGYACTPRPGGSGVSDCVEDIQCVSPADCGGLEGSTCVGESSAKCNYPIETASCTTDADCTALPNGTCYWPGVVETLCYPSGECMAREPLCHYPALTEVCDSDVDCKVASGGYCDKVISHTHCQDDDCLRDSDCGGTYRCACASNLRLTCFAAECQSDADCGTGQRCQRGNPCGYGPYGDFYCTTANDECSDDEDCTRMGKLHCDFEVSKARWQCNELICDPR